jgi:hypothetical protein
MTPIELGEPFGGGLVVKRGPVAGTKVVKNPSPELVDGKKVKEKGDD